jgi:hypothetical protein
MKQDKKIQEKQEFNSAISRFGMYLFGKIKKILKKLLANPKIQKLVFDYALTCQFNEFLPFSFKFFFFFIHTIWKEQDFFSFFFYSRPNKKEQKLYTKIIIFL